MLLHGYYMDTHKVGLAAGEVCSPHYRLLSKQSRYTVCQVLIQQMMSSTIRSFVVLFSSLILNR